MQWEPGWLDLQQQPPTHSLIHGRQGFLCHQGQLLWPRSQLEPLGLPVLAEQGLGRWNGEPVSVLELATGADQPLAGDWQSLRSLMGQGQRPALVQLAVYVAQIGAWRQEHCFCGHAVRQSSRCLVTRQWRASAVVFVSTRSCRPA